MVQEKACNVKRDRAALARAIRQLGPGDVLRVTRLDRLARFLVDLLNILEAITKQGAGFKSLAETTTPHGRPLVTFVGGIAEFKRDLIKARTSASDRKVESVFGKFRCENKILGRRCRAKLAGKTLGRDWTVDQFQRREALARKEAGELDRAVIVRSYGVHRSTISWLKPETRPTHA